MEFHLLLARTKVGCYKIWFGVSWPSLDFQATLIEALFNCIKSHTALQYLSKSQLIVALTLAHAVMAKYRTSAASAAI